MSGAGRECGEQGVSRCVQMEGVSLRTANKSLLKSVPACVCWKILFPRANGAAGA